MAHHYDDNDSVMSHDDETYYSAGRARIDQCDWTWHDLASFDSIDDEEIYCDHVDERDERHYHRWKFARLITHSACSTSDTEDIAKQVQHMLTNHEVYLFQNDATGLLPLHYALFVGAPLAIIKMLADDHPSAILHGYKLAGEEEHRYHEKTGARSALIITPVNKETTRYLIERAIQYLQAPYEDDYLSRRAEEWRDDMIEDCFVHHVHRHDICEPLLKAFPEFARRKSRFSAYESPSMELRLKEKELPLHLAVRLRAPAQVLQLLIPSHPLALVQEGSDGKLPLHFGCSQDIGPVDKDTIKALVTPLAVRARDVSGMLPLHVLCKDIRSYPLDMDVICSLVDPYPESVGKLCGRGYAPIHSVCRNASVEDLLIVSYMADQCPECVEFATARGETPLEIACLTFETTEDATVVRFLAQNYPESLSRGYSSYGPLHRACVDKNFPLIQCLVEACPQSMDKLGYNGRTPFHILCEYAVDEDLPLVRFLDSSFPELATRKDRDGWTPLDAALQRRFLGRYGQYECNEGVIRFLVKQHPELVEPRNDDETTVLHNACSIVSNDRLCIDVARLQMLSISEKAVTARNEDGRTPFHLLSMYGPVPALQSTLLAVCPDLVRMTDNERRLPLHGAVQALVSAEKHLARNPRRERLRNEDDWSDDGYNDAHYESQERVDRCNEAVNFLLELYPSAVTALDNDGVSPLILACEQDASVDLIFRLVTVNPVETLGIVR